jgi:hypothetical protein
MDALFERLNHEIDISFDAVESKEWLCAPERKWSIAQIAEHLSRAYGGTAKMLELALASDQHPEITPATLKERIARFIVIRMGYFPSGVRAPKKVQPTGLNGNEALRRVHENIARMDVALNEAEKRWGSGVLANHPILGPLAPDEWRKFHLLHGLHHLRQVRRRRSKLWDSTRAV